MIRINGLVKTFQSSRGEITVLNGVNLTLPEKGLVFFLGESGSGKSTFFYLLSGVQGDYSGTVEVDGSDIKSFDEKQWNNYRNQKIGIVFQNYGLFERCSVIDNVLFPTEITSTKREEDVRNAEKLLEYVGLKGFENSVVSELSGGEKQRVAIARSLMNQPDILLADEPTGNLDRKMTESIFELFQKISKECLVCVVTHDRESAMEYGDFVYELRDGAMKEIITGHDETAEVAQLSEKGKAAVKKLPLRDAFKRAFRKAPREWVKLIAGITLLTILMVFALTLWNLHALRREKVIRRYIDEQRVPFFFTETTKSFRNLYGEDEEHVISSGSVFFTEMKNLIGEEKLIPRITGAFFTAEDDVEVCEGNIVVSERLLPYCEINGEAPRKAGEIAICSAVAEKLHLKEPYIGSSVVYDNRKYIVTGTISLHYPTTVNPKNDINGDVFGVFTYAHDLENTLAMIHPSDLEERKNTDKSLGLPYANPYDSDWEGHLLSSNEKTYYGGLTRQDSVHLVAGRMPERDDEVLVSIESPNAEEMFEQNSYRSFYSIHADKYKDCFSDEMDLSEFFPNGYKVVGVFDDFSYGDAFVDEVPHVLVSETVFTAMKEKYYSQYVYRQFFVLTDDLLTEAEIAEILDKGYRITEPNIDRIQIFSDSLKELDTYFILGFGAVVIGIFAVAMLTIAASIRDREYLLGIMRSMGYSRGDLSRMFFSEAAVVASISIALSIVVFLSIQKYANCDYVRRVAGNPFDIMVFGPWNTIYLVLGCVAVLFLAAFIPIMRLSKKKPYELICCGNKE